MRNLRAAFRAFAVAQYLEYDRLRSPFELLLKLLPLLLTESSRNIVRAVALLDRRIAALGELQGHSPARV